MFESIFTLNLFEKYLGPISFIKQFVVTNCSKERPGSMVTETLKNGILIPIVTSNESHFNADFTYIIIVMKLGIHW